MDDIRRELIKYHKEYETDKEGLNHAETAISDLAARSGTGKVPAGEGMDLYQRKSHTIGSGITERFIRDGGMDYIGARITGPEDLAAMMQAYRNPLFETTRVFYLRENEVVAVEGVSNRLPNLVTVEFADADTLPEHIMLSMDHYGADSFYLLHNHPSGDPTPSFSDRKLTISAGKATGFNGHVIINHKTFALIDREGNHQMMRLPGNSKDLFLRPSLDHPLLGTKVPDAESLAEIGKQLEVIQNDKISYLIYCTKDEIRALQEVSSDVLMMGDDFSTWLLAQMKGLGASSSMCVTSNPDAYNRLEKVVKESYMLDAVYLDSDHGLFWSKRKELGMTSCEDIFDRLAWETTIYYETNDSTGTRQWSHTPQQRTFRLFVDLDGTLAVFTPVEQLETLYEQGYFRDLEPHGNAIEGIKLFMRANPETEVFVLSSVLADSKYALAEKQAWLDRYLPEIDRNHRIFPPCGENKADYVPGGISKTDILIDDYTVSLLIWEVSGGNAIKVMNGINGTKGRWLGRRLDALALPESFASGLRNAIRRIEMEGIAMVREGKENDTLLEMKKEGPVMEDKQINTVVVNAFGGPGVGKTTCSWEIASELKKQGLCVEYVSEYAKELVWEDNLQMLDGTVEHQKILLDEQEKRIQRLIGKADVVVTDSPLLLNITYCKDCPDDYRQEVLERFNSYNNFCFLVKRDMFLDFEDRGRIHNFEESIEKDKEIQSFLEENGIYHGVYSHAQSRTLVKNIVTSFNRLNKFQQTEEDMGKTNGQEMKKRSLADYLGRPAELIATYEELYYLSDTERITNYVGDYMQYEIKYGTSLEAAERLYKKGLEAIGLTAAEYESDTRYTMRGHTILDICKKNNLPIPRDIQEELNRQSNYEEYRADADNKKNVTFEEKKALFQSMSYEEQFKTVLEAEMPESRGMDGLQEDLYQEYMRSDQAGFFGNQLHKQFRDKIQERTRQKVIREDMNLE